MVGNKEVFDLQTNSNYPTRSLSDIKTISIHHWSGGNLTPSSTIQEELVAMKAVRATHTTKNGWPDYAYHFTVCPSGRCYYTGPVGTLRYVVGTWRGNQETIAVALPGDFTNEVPGQEQLAACADLIANLQFAFGNTLTVVPHKHYTNTACPGDTWDQWKSSLTSNTVIVPTSGSTEVHYQGYALEGTTVDNSAETLLFQFPYPSSFPDTLQGKKDQYAWNAGWARSMQETVGLSERLERAFIYFVLGYTESGWDHTIQNTAGEPSYGIFQRHLYGSAANMRKQYGAVKTIEMLTDPSLEHQFAWTHDEIDKAFDKYWSAGYRGPQLAILVGRDAERPAAGNEAKYGLAWTHLRSQVAW